MSRSIRRILFCASLLQQAQRRSSISADHCWPALALYPQASGGPPSNACCLSLLRVGFTEPAWSPRSLVVSYTTVSP